MRVPALSSSIARSIVCFAALVLGFTVANADESPITSVGDGTGILQPGERGSCPDFYLNADDTYEGGYAWQYGGVVPPDLGSFAECYEGPIGVCAVVLDLSQAGNQIGQTLDAYVWEDDGGSPGAVLCITTDVDPGPVAFWPSISRHSIDLGTVCDATDEFWVGYWANWPDQVAGWFISADLDGFGGCPLTKYAPGMGFPSGWGNVSAAWGPTQSLGIGLEGTVPKGYGACCLPNGVCEITTEFDCQGDFIGEGEGCVPDLCLQPEEGACCQPDGQCAITNAFDCEESGGSYLGDDTGCDPDPCPEPFGACCFPDGSCTDLLLPQCTEQGGAFTGDGSLCESSPCSDSGACCINDRCFVRTSEDCLAEDGIFLGFDVPCDPEVCFTISCDGALVTLGEMGFEGDLSNLSKPEPMGISGRGVLDPVFHQGAERGCGIFELSADESYESGYIWRESSIEPCYGSFAEKYVGSGREICAITLDLAATGTQNGQLLDAYVWDDSGNQPGVVLHVEVGVDPGLVAPWPSVSRHIVPIPATPVGNEWWVGFWADWQGMGGAWYIGADTDGPGGNGSMTLVPPGEDIGRGWQPVSNIWGSTQALGIGVSYLVQGAGACCFGDGSCIVLEMEDCTGEFQGESTDCDPNPCPPPPFGACCFVNGSCTISSDFDCEADGGTYFGEDVECDPNPCPQPGVGACCLPDQNCVEISIVDCLEQGGLFLGKDSVCDGVVCPILCDASLTSRSHDPARRGGGTGPNRNGTLILHHDDELVYTADGGGFCDSSLEDCLSATIRVDTEGPVVFQVFAAFGGPNTPRLVGVTFGIDYSDCLFIVDGDHCGDFELPQSSWPEPETGTAVTWTVPQETFLVPVYWFAGYVDGGQATTLDLIPHPDLGAFFGDDSIPAILDPILDLGSLGFKMDGRAPCPTATETGACCLSDGSCQVLLEEECTPIGEFLGRGVPCDPNPCFVPVGACCFEDESCGVLTESECQGSGGVFLADEDCDPNPCVTVPTIESTWGRIKARFSR